MDGEFTLNAIIFTAENLAVPLKCWGKSESVIISFIPCFLYITEQGIFLSIKETVAI